MELETVDAMILPVVSVCHKVFSIQQKKVAMPESIATL
jgi:hypothetical protein